MQKDDIVQNKLENRKNRTDRRKHCSEVRTSIATDNNYKEINRKRALVTTHRRLKENAEYRERNRQGTHRRLKENAEYRERNKEAAQRRLKESAEYRQRNRHAALRNVRKKLEENSDYRDSNRQLALVNARRKLQNPDYKEKNKEKSLNRHRRLAENSSYREHRRRLSYERRQGYNQQCTTQNQIRIRSNQRITEQKRYWIRRSRLITQSRRRRYELQLQQQMTRKSEMSALAVKIMFRKAQRRVGQGLSKLNRLHVYMKEKASAYLEKLSQDQSATEDQFTAAVDGIRYHTCSSEPYFWDSSYSTLPADHTVAVDSAGNARLFDTLTSKSVQHSTATTEHTKVRRWHCNTLVCKITEEMTGGVTELMNRLLTIKTPKLMSFYLELDKCDNAARTDQLGHPHHCTLHENCESLLRPVRQLACHYPYLRTFAARLYEQRRTCMHIRAVQMAKTNGSYTDLKNAVSALADFLNKTFALQKNEENSPVERTCAVEEDAVVEQFCSALTDVTDIRDTYTTTACDVCEQLRDDVDRLAAYEGRKGFSSDKMTAMIELLYQRKTQVEDVDEFFQTIRICRYCADKLRANKDIARCAFNKLSVEETPPCIAQLNIFETALIKHCMTSITIVRLGQITNAYRPRNELTAAMKGRIAYLPVDVAANASFVPDDILNVDSCVLLVGGQPTKNHKIWTSVVDLRKVHTALMWLRDNNKYYENIPAYTVDQLQDILTKRLTSENDDDMHRPGKALIQKLNQAAKSHLYENFSIQPLTGEFPADTLIDYQLKKVEETAESIFGADLDVKAYPELFPTGENGMRDVSRTVKISTTDFLRSRLLNKNPKFRLNINYLFHSFQVQEVSNMCHSVGHMLRTVSTRGLTAQSLFDRLKNGDGELNGKLFAMMANMRGTTEYFSKLAMDIRWMVRRLGPPTLFVTVSIAEWYSEPLLEYLRNVNCGKGRDVEKMTAAELCAMDPVSVNIHFHKKWHAIFSKLIKSKTTPIFGEVVDHFWRIEYQSRGAPHVHCLLWVKDAPVLGRDSPDAVKAYIDNIITCAKPDANASPTLHDHVTQFQTHKCNRYCLKSYRRNGQFYRKCRFGFPRPVRATTQLNNVIDCLAVNQTKQPRKRLYNVQRTEQETRVNDYNPALLLASQSNVDVQYIGHAGSRLPYYITSYVTKHERCEQDKMWEDIHSASRSLASNAMSFALKAVKSRQVGANEAADRLLGHKLYSKSRQMRFADLRANDQAKRVLKPVAEIEKLLQNDPDSQEIFYPHWVLDVYPDRPDELENMSLYEFLSQYEKERSGSQDQLKLKTLGYFLRKRTQKPYLVTHQLVNPNRSPEDEQQYYYQLLKLFKPWRAETDFISSGQTYKECFANESEQNPEMRTYHSQLVHQHQSDEATDDAIKKKRQEMEQEETDKTVEDEESAFGGCAINTVEAAMQDVIDAHRNMNCQESSIMTDLNTDQRRIVDTVLHQVSQTEESVCRLIVSGEGGTGKSRVIHVLRQAIAEKFAGYVLPVAVTAPTGLAAFNIGGTTIHRLLSLPVEHGKPADYARLQQEQLTIIRATLKDLKLLIIDEVSMVSSLTLLYIHLRLTEIMSTNSPFGGVSIVCFGDFMQLPPVKGNQPFQPVTAREAKQRLGAISSLSLWQTFTYDELTVNMRQHGDSTYANLLSNVRLGSINDNEHSLLESRRISADRRATTEEVTELYHNLTGQQLSPIILMPRTEQCAVVNEAMLKQLESDVLDIPAIDTLDTVIDEHLLPKVEKAYQKLEQDTTRTAGLVKCLRLCVGAKVMLKRNISVEAGLVNGAVGTVTGFDKKKRDGRIEVIVIDFHNIGQTARIERQSSTFEVLKCIYYTRKQFPLTLAFAITIHKSQGLSLRTAIIDVGQDCFGSGMSYVALSRVSSLNGLHLINYDRQKIVANRCALAEYNRLRMQHTPHLGCLPVPKRDHKSSSLPTNCTANECQYAQMSQNESDTQDKVPGHNDKPPLKRRKCRNRTECNDQTNTNRAPGMTPQMTLSPHGSTNSSDIYKHCSITSISTEYMQNICEEMNLVFDSSGTSFSTARSPMAKSAEKIIKSLTNVQVSVHIFETGTDGNCLFRALSLAVSQNECNHDIIRSYVANHMLDDRISQDMENLFTANTSQHRSFQEHIINMQKLGTWGTEQEIVSAAHLFNCSILCCSRYGSTGDVCIQHFPPHFASNPACAHNCHHQTLYLVNTGSHYEPAAVYCKERETSRHENREP